VRHAQLVGGIVALGLVLGAQTLQAQTYDTWRSSPAAHPEPPGGKSNHRRKKKDKKEEKKKDPSKDPSSKPNGGPQSPSPGAPGAPGSSLPSAPSGPSLPSLGGAGLPTGVSLPGSLPMGAPPAPGAPAPPGGVPTAPAATPPAAGGPAAAAPAGVAAEGVVAGGPVAAAAGAAPVAGAPVAGAPVAGVAGGGAAGGGLVPVAAVAGATTAVAITEVGLTSIGAALVGPHEAVALMPNLVDVLADKATSGELTGDAEAADLTKTGEKMLEGGNVTFACQVFERVFSARRTFPNLARLSRCYDAAGQFASAWLGYSTVAGAGDDPALREKAAAESTRLGSALSRLTLAIGPSPGSEPSVLYDGHPVASQYWGKPLPLDPGDHVVIVRVAGQPDWLHRFSIAKTPQEETVRWPEPVAAPPVPEDRPWYVSNCVLISGSLTVATGVAGAIVGGWTLSKRSQFESENGQSGYPAQTLDGLRNSARTGGIVTTALLGATVVGLVVTPVLIATNHSSGSDSKPPPTTPTVSVGTWVQGHGAGIALGGVL